MKAIHYLFYISSKLNIVIKNAQVQVKVHRSVPFTTELYYCTVLFNDDVTIR